MAGLLILWGQKEKIRHLAPHFICILALAFIEVKIIGFSTGEAQYQTVFNLKTMANTLSWYGLWAFGLPGTLIDYVGPGLKLNPNLMANWGGYYKVIFPAFAASVVLFAAAVFKSRPRLMDRRVGFFAFWFVAGLLPVLFLPSHKEVYYLGTVLPAFWALVFYLIFGARKYSKVLSVLFMVCLLTLTVYSIKLGSLTYWVVDRGRLSYKIMSGIKEKYPVLPKGAVLYIKNDPDYPFIAREWGGTSKQASLILSNSDALELLYDDPALTVYFEDFGFPVEESPKSNVFDFVVKL